MTATDTTDATVEAITEDDLGAAARTLAVAAHDDPVVAWIAPDPDRRAEVLPSIVTAGFTASGRHARAHRTGSDGAVTGIAVWASPGAAPVRPVPEAVLDRGELDRLLAWRDRSAAAHPRTPAWFLQFLAVDGAHQGQGLGSALLAHVLAEADWRGEWAYVEATSPRNRAFYERHGFRCTGELVVPGGPTGDAMWRSPWAAPVR